MGCFGKNNNTNDSLSKLEVTDNEKKESIDDRKKAKVLTEEEKNKLKKAKDNAHLKKKILGEIEKPKDKVFDSFVTKQKKQAKKKYLLVSLMCIAILGVSSYVVYKEYFTNDCITRKTNFDMDFDDVMVSERFLFDSKKPDMIGDCMLIYDDVKYKDITGDIIYYFHQTGKALSFIAFKFDYSKDSYDYLLESLSADYGNSEEVEKNDNEDIRLVWNLDNGTCIRLVSSEKQKTIEIDIGKII